MADKKKLSKVERKQQAWDEYERKRKPLDDEFERKVKQLVDELERKEKPLKDEYKRICAEIDEEDDDD